ncbi:aspartyl aminopeptidase [Striga asiatica]|uniref:Aspartyl aminopeptidase n=1 Tax=Striga asiatica TaxID=4170 RepID=A0A5A7QKE4_STRAF|nr:aspartyl aminopeptidase [Striga asiatica]
MPRTSTPPRALRLRKTEVVEEALANRGCRQWWEMNGWTENDGGSSGRQVAETEPKIEQIAIVLSLIIKLHLSRRGFQSLIIPATLFSRRHVEIWNFSFAVGDPTADEQAEINPRRRPSTRNDDRLSSPSPTLLSRATLSPPTAGRRDEQRVSVVRPILRAVAVGHKPATFESSGSSVGLHLAAGTAAAALSGPCKKNGSRSRLLSSSHFPSNLL